MQFALCSIARDGFLGAVAVLCTRTTTHRRSVDSVDLAAGCQPAQCTGTGTVPPLLETPVCHCGNDSGPGVLQWAGRARTQSAQVRWW